MKKFFAIMAAAAVTVSLTACGGNGGQEQKKDIARLTPDMVLPLATAAGETGTSLVMADEGIVNDNGMITCTYVANPIGSADSVSIGIEQFSDTVTVKQVWDAYEDARVYRSDMEFVQGIGEDCYIAYPFICVYDRGCYIKISAGSGNTEEQKNLLIKLAESAAAVVEGAIPEDAAKLSASSENVIQ